MSVEPILAIVGASEAPSQDAGTHTPVGLMAEASVAALAQTGLTTDEVDGLFSASAYYYMPTVTLGDYLNVRPTYSDSSTIGGDSFVGHLGHAAAAIAAGRMSVGLIAYGSTQRSDGRRQVRSMADGLAYEVPYGPHWPLTGYAMMAQRHMAEFGTTSEQLAEIAVAAREWALRNPAAPRRERLTVDDVLASPMISTPLHRLDCCLVTDGGGALVVTAPDRAADYCEEPVYVWAVEETHHSRYVSGMPSFVTSPAATTGPRALAHAQVRLSEIDVFQVYDAFTISVLVALEDLGLCPKGDGGAFVTEGVLRPGGRIPLNTSGGGLSYRHPGMLGMVLLLEAVSQLRSQAGERQVSGAESALVHGLGGVHNSGVTAVLGGPAWRR